jgi:hypothetical protein
LFLADGVAAPPVLLLLLLLVLPLLSHIVQ